MTGTARRDFRARAARASFTLVELLVAVAVLALLLVFAAQLVSMASHTTLADSRKIDALAQARLALDRFGLDWSAHIARGDVDVSFVKNAGNDEIAFATQMPSPDGTRSVALVDYRVNAVGTPGNNAYRLERGLYGYSWAGGNSFAFPLSQASYSSLLAAANYQTLAPGVFRLEVCLLVKAATNGASGYWWPAGTTVASLTSPTNVAAVIVAVAALDDSTRKLVDDTHLARLAGALADVSGADPVATWQAALSRPQDITNSTGVSLPVAQAVRVYERYFYVNVVP